MKKITLFFTAVICALGAGTTTAGAAACSVMGLTRCLDSVCAINIGTNPAARCQLCGDSSAGTAPIDGMRSVSVGASTRNTISEKELKAYNTTPRSPGERYKWATTECLKKVTDCTPDDVTDAYDNLIEQSCTAANISIKMAELHTEASKTKDQATCEAEIKLCFVTDKHCGANLMACKDDADFNKFFSSCSATATGCSEYTGKIRSDLVALRDAAVQAQSDAFANIIKSRQDNRMTDFNAAQESCKNNVPRPECILGRCQQTAHEACIKDMCDKHTKNKCGAGFESEMVVATLLCKYHETACSRLK